MQRVACRGGLSKWRRVEGTCLTVDSEEWEAIQPQITLNVTGIDDRDRHLSHIKFSPLGTN